MTREEAIKILWIHKSKSIYVNSIAKAIDMAIEALKAQEWIPVSESPKQEKKEYLILIHIVLNQMLLLKEKIV